jgi:hypothetical protein
MSKSDREEAVVKAEPMSLAQLLEDLKKQGCHDDDIVVKCSAVVKKSRSTLTYNYDQKRA